MQTIICICYVLPVIVLIAGAVSKESKSSKNSLPPTKYLKNITLDQVTWEAVPELTDNDILPNGENFAEYEVPFNMSAKYVYYQSGYDFDDLPVWIVEAGNWNIAEELRNGHLKELDVYFKQFAYRALQTIRASSTPEKPITHDVLILDFANLRLDHVTHLPSLSFIITNLRQATYIIKTFTAQVIIINANYATEVLIKYANPILGGFFEHVQIYGNNKAKWLPKLLRIIPRSSLPEWYGGVKDFKPLKVYG